MKVKIRLYGAVILAMIFWAFSFIWFKMANEDFRPITVVFLRLVFAIILLTAYLTYTKRFVKIRKSDYKLFFLMSLFEPFIYFLGESYGLTYVSATVCSVLISTIPVFAAIGARLIFKERLSFLNYSGIILSFIGVVIFVLNKDGSFSYSPKGIALIFVAVFSAVGYNLTLSRLVEHYSPIYIVNVQNIIGAVLFLPLFLTMELRPFLEITFNFKMFIPVILLSVFASCAAFILFAFSVRNLGLMKANVFTNSIPLFTAFFSFLLLGDMLTVQNLIGMVVVIAGLYMSQLRGRIEPPDEALTLTGKTA
ncbi:MAG: DMT family transporter [Bacteroidetes bacterium]|nr:DMT family transporter [Bacteroidota bacterium]